MISEIEKRRNDIEIVFREEGVSEEEEEEEEEESQEKPSRELIIEIMGEIFRKAIGISIDDLNPSEKRDIEQVITEMI